MKNNVALLCDKHKNITQWLEVTACVWTFGIRKKLAEIA